MRERKVSDGQREREREKSDGRRERERERGGNKKKISPTGIEPVT